MITRDFIYETKGCNIKLSNCIIAKPTEQESGHEINNTDRQTNTCRVYDLNTFEKGIDIHVFVSAKCQKITCKGSNV